MGLEKVIHIPGGLEDCACGQYWCTDSRDQRQGLVIYSSSLAEYDA